MSTIQAPTVQAPTFQALPYEDRLNALREQLARDSLNGFVVPLTDEHMSEYVGGYARRLAWLTGFQGSAGSAAVLPERAAIFTDGRYTLQVRTQVDGAHWDYVGVPQSSVAEWLQANAPSDARIGYDPWLHTRAWVKATTAALAAKGATLVAVDRNPIDVVWTDRPLPSDAKLAVHVESLAGRSAADKRREIAEWLTEQGADALILSALDSIAWAFNIRGSDVDHTPVALAFAVIHADATADLFVAREKLDDAVARHLGNSVRLHARDAFPTYLADLKDKSVAIDPERAVAAIFDRLERARARLLVTRDPVVLAKAIKNPAEIAGHRAAQLRDNAALVRFLHWLSAEAPKGELTELIASDRLEAFRRDTGKLRDLSFDTISGAGPNGAIVHYRADESTNRPLVPGSLYLVDSGGQYEDGTTDITRTVAIGEPTAEMRERFTLVLKGHIALATAVFPIGTCGAQLDTLARQFLWARGLDYAHGTGHGVGSFLSVHEGPQRIAASTYPGGGPDEPLRAGMILSNEPGYYKTGDYGIRIENLILVQDRDVLGAEQSLLGFETLSYVPIDRTLIDLSLLSPQERAWVDAYHAECLTRLASELQGDVLAWLRAATQPL